MLACQDTEHGNALSPEAGEAATYCRAANGNHDAQVYMAWLALTKGMEGRLALTDATLMALMWTNMAATSGKAEHALAHASVMLVEADQAIKRGCPESKCSDVFAQALAIVDKVADTGHGRAELVSLALASWLPAATIAKAQKLRAGLPTNSFTTIEPLPGSSRRPGSKMSDSQPWRNVDETSSTRLSTT